MNDVTRLIAENSGLSKPALIFLDVFLFLLIVTLLIYFLKKRIALYKIGKEVNRKDQPARRIFNVFSSALFQSSLVKRRAGWGLIHILLYSGFVVLFIGTTIIFIQEYFARPLFGWDFFRNNFYIIFSFFMDIFGLAAIFAVIAFAWRRLISKSKSLDLQQDFNISLFLVFLVLVSGFLVEAARIALTFPEFEKWSFVGWLIAQMLPASPVLHGFLWWLHLILSALLILTILKTTLRHIFISSANIYFSRLDNQDKGALIAIPEEEFESAETFGLSKLEDLTWQQVLSLDACVACGRCTDVCPANISGKSLNPKDIIRNITRHWLEIGPDIIVVTNGKNEEMKKQSQDKLNQRKNLNGEVIAINDIWACTNCRACVDTCPVAIEHIDIIDDLRRNLVMVEGNMPEELEVTLRNLENQNNPWGMGTHKREEWLSDLDVPRLKDHPDTEYLFYVGCAGALNERNQKVSRAMVSILNAAGVSYGILGEEERCCGDHARRAGNEYLYQMMAAENMEVLNKYKVRKIITTCPHGFHNLKKEYKQFGGNYEVYHHTEIIEQLIRENKVKLNLYDSGASVTFHDSCFMGRYNDIIEEPRLVLKLAGLSLKEMKRTGLESFCCGAGGARMWMEEEKDERVNIRRVEESLQTGAEKICVSCPYCMTMYEDGMKEIQSSSEVLDIAEIIAQVIVK